MAREIDIEVTLDDFERSKYSRYSITECLVATTLKRHFRTLEVKVGVNMATVDGTPFNVNATGRELIRNFIHNRDEDFVSLLPITITITTNEE